MSFLKITDPKKRDFIVEEFLKSKRKIKENNLSEKLGDIGLQQDLTKWYKPILDSQSGMSSDLSALKQSSTATVDALKTLPASISTSLKAIQFPQHPSIDAFESPGSAEGDRTVELGAIASMYLQEYASDKRSTDTTFGIHSKDGVFYIGDSPITIDGDDITVGEKTYIGTPGLWELITMTNPDSELYDTVDMVNYAEILNETNAIRQPNNPRKPRASRSNKYRNIIKPIWDNRDKKPRTGEGVVVLPHDPNGLIEMLALRMASFKAGNTGVRNEIISICDELLRQRLLTTDEYKKIMIYL